MTEEEAKTKRCPLARKEDGSHIEGVNCIASGCMMWRGSGHYYVDASDGKLIYHHGGGYCGLGGEP